MAFFCQASGTKKSKYCCHPPSPPPPPIFCRCSLKLLSPPSQHYELDTVVTLTSVLRPWHPPKIWSVHLRSGYYLGRTRMNAQGEGHYWSHAWDSWLDMAPTRRLWVGDWNKCIFHLTQDWTCLGRGHYSSWILINGGRGQNVGTIQVTPWTIIYVRPGLLARYVTGVNHYQM